MITSIVILLDGRDSIATLTLSTAKVALLLANNTMHIGVQLGNLSLTDDSSMATNSSAYKQLVSIEGSNLLDLTYETFDDETAAAPGGVNSAVTLRSGSVKVHFLEEPFHDLYAFLIKFARLKTLYDSATQAAVQKASEISRMKFDVSIQSPVVIIPDRSFESSEHLVLRLGEITAKNEYSAKSSTILAGLTGISLTSTAEIEDETVSLSIVEAVDIHANVINHDEPDVDTQDHRTPPESEVCLLHSFERSGLT